MCADVCDSRLRAATKDRYMHEKKPLYKDDSNVRNGTTHFIKGEKDTYNFEQSKYYLRRTFLAFFLRNPSIASYVVGKQPCFCHIQTLNCDCTSHKRLPV